MKWKEINKILAELVQEIDAEKVPCDDFSNYSWLKNKQPDFPGGKKPGEDEMTGPTLNRSLVVV